MNQEKRPKIPRKMFLFEKRNKYAKKGNFLGIVKKSDHLEQKFFIPEEKQGSPNLSV